MALLPMAMGKERNHNYRQRCYDVQGRERSPGGSRASSSQSSIKDTLQTAAGDPKRTQMGAKFRSAQAPYLTTAEAITVVTSPLYSLTPGAGCARECNRV